MEPQWGDWRQLRLATVPAGVQACGAGGFRVRLLRQGWARPRYSEGRVLRLRRGGVALLREVELLCDGRPWVFARTLIPAASLQGSARRLTQLGERPLGAVLFSDPAIRRGLTQVARLLPRHPLFQAACAHLQAPPAELWGRRTLFYVDGQPLLVNEIFLPDIPRGPAP